ncbi:aryl-sulfate sulfotransferase [Aquimarina sp. SS2-1]|uniref:aryl-sulfate sulfotransferase n=1 Tax=Aquimarina besae TaxID=3342247 RepID=UPI00367181A0
MKKIFFIALFISSVNTFSQNTIGTTLNTEAALNGYTLFSSRSTSTPSITYLINNCGEIVNQWSSNFRTFGVDYLTENGDLYSNHFDDQSTLNLRGNTGRIEKKDWNNNLLWGFTYSDTDYSFHHDYVVMPNGNILMMVAYRMTETEAIDSGRNPSLLSEGELYNEKIIEIQPIGVDGGQIIWEWSAWDHLIQDFDPSKNNFGIIKDNPEKIDINFTGTSGSTADWLHLSSMDYNPELDQIIFSSPRISEFYIIDHSTTTAEAATSSGGNSGKGGDILYRWGNPQIYDQGTSADQKTFGQHTVHWIPKGLNDEDKILFYNNAKGGDYSSVEIINPPIDQNGNYSYTPNTAYAPIDAEWSYTDPTSPQNLYSPLISSAYRLPNGNTLITEGTSGHILEIDANENTVWDYITPYRNDVILSQGETNTGAQVSWIFRAKRYPYNYAGFVGKDLTPSGYIEQNPVTENCSLFDALSVEEFNLSFNFSIYPNPVSNTINITNKTNQNYSVELFDFNGKKIEFSLINEKINISSLNSGFYILKVNTDNGSLIKKIVKI